MFEEPMWIVLVAVDLNFVIVPPYFSSLSLACVVLDPWFHDMNHSLADKIGVSIASKLLHFRETIHAALRE